MPASSQVLVVPKDSPHAQEAIDFGLFVTNDDNQLAFCQQVAILPSTKRAAADPFFRAAPRNLSDQANQVSAADLPNAFVAAPPDVLCKALLDAAKDHAGGVIDDDTAIMAIRRD